MEFLTMKCNSPLYHSSIKKTEDRSCPRKERGSNWQFEQWDCFVFSMFWHFFALHVSLHICSTWTSRWNHIIGIILGMVDLFLEMLFIVLIFLHAAQPKLNQLPFSFFQKYSSWDQHVKIVPHLIMQLMQTTQKVFLQHLVASSILHKVSCF